MVTTCSTRNSRGEAASTFPPYSLQNSIGGEPCAGFQRRYGARKAKATGQPSHGHGASSCRRAGETRSATRTAKPKKSVVTFVRSPSPQRRPKSSHRRDRARVRITSRAYAADTWKSWSKAAIEREVPNTKKLGATRTA